MHRRIYIFSLIALGCLCASAHADPEADEFSRQAIELAKNKDFRGALELYEQALERDPAPQRQCNVGAAYFQLDQWAPAHLFLGLCLSHTGILSAAVVEQMSKAFAFADRKLQKGDFGQVDFESSQRGAMVQVPSLAKSARFKAPRTVWLPIAQHSFIASVDGFDNQVGTFEVRSKERGTRMIEFKVPTSKAPMDVAPPLEADPVDSSTSVRSPVETPRPTQLPAPEGSSHVARWSVLVIGAGSLITGAVFHIQAAGTRSELTDTPAGQERSSLIADLKGERLMMGVFYGTAAIAIGVGTYLWVSTESEESRSRPSASVGVDQASLGWSWQY